MRKKDVERISRLEAKAEIRKKNVADYFVTLSRWHREWMQDLAERYKVRGEFPMLPMLILPSYYTDSRDKEIASFVSLYIQEDGEFSRIQSFLEVLGRSPWEWFKNRDFVRLSIGDMQYRRTGGVENWKIARLLDSLWKETFARKECPDGLFADIVQIASVQRCSYFDVLTYLVDGCGVGHYFYKLRLLLMVLGTSDGLGLGLWNVDSHNLMCPYATGIRQFVHTWFPDYGRIGTVDDAIKLFGFERDSDFFYAYLGYKELQKTAPKACGLYATRYNSWYSHGSSMKKYRWVGIQPEIPF